MKTLSYGAQHLYVMIKKTNRKKTNEKKFKIKFSNNFKI